MLVPGSLWVPLAAELAYWLSEYSLSGSLSGVVRSEAVGRRASLSRARVRCGTV